MRTFYSSFFVSPLVSLFRVPDISSPTWVFFCFLLKEYMDDPFRCGNATCGGRFCRPCLQRILRLSTSSGTSLELTDASTNSVRCPNCRSFFSMASASAYDVLREEICDCDYAIPPPLVAIPRLGVQSECELLHCHVNNYYTVT
jgi:hypothetical protein